MIFSFLLTIVFSAFVKHLLTIQIKPTPFLVFLIVDFFGKPYSRIDC